MAHSAVLSYCGRYEEGLAAARAAEHCAAAQGADDAVLLARSRAQQTVCLGLSGLAHEAAGPAAAALAPAEASGDRALLATVLSVLRETERRAGRYGDALTHGHRALALAEQAGRPRPPPSSGPTSPNSTCCAASGRTRSAWPWPRSNSPSRSAAPPWRSPSRRWPAYGAARRRRRPPDCWNGPGAAPPTAATSRP
ncbi:hypothetical protein O1L55_33265 [Streptomyces albulus]|nr:hypothetical protein [Streptomyces noursei]